MYQRGKHKASSTQKISWLIVRNLEKTKIWPSHYLKKKHFFNTNSIHTSYTAFSYAGTLVNIYRLPFRPSNTIITAIATDRRSISSNRWPSLTGRHFLLRSFSRVPAAHVERDSPLRCRHPSHPVHRPHGPPAPSSVDLIQQGHPEDKRRRRAVVDGPVVDALHNQTVAFTLACFDDCRQFAKEFKTHPAQHFSHFKLAYCTDGWRRIEIKLIDVVAESSQLLNKISAVASRDRTKFCWPLRMTSICSGTPCPLSSTKRMRPYSSCFVLKSITSQSNPAKNTLGHFLYVKDSA